MNLSPFLVLPSESDYKQYFIDNYCNRSPLLTWDGLPVMFYPEMFEHAFYERTTKTWKSPKTTVDFDRCKRMPWIEEVLKDSSIIPLQGYDKAINKYDNSRRVVLISPEQYLVVIRQDKNKWRFVTAYLVDNVNTLNKILASPKWVCPVMSSAQKC